MATVFAKAGLCATSVALAACGGSSPTVDPTFAAAQQNFLTDAAAIGFSSSSEPTNATLPADITLTDGATYSGPLALIVRNSGSASDIDMTAANLETEGMVGQMTMTLDLASATPLGGEATGFIRPDGEAVGGTLTMSDTFFVIVPNASVTYNLTPFAGSLTNTPVGNVNLNGAIVGGFADPDAVIWGESASTTGTPFRGQFIASED